MEITGRSPLRVSLAASLVLALLVGLLTANGRVSYAAVEDFTTWTEVDENADITVASSTLTVDTMDRSADSWTQTDEGAGTIGDFIHQFEFNLSALTTTGNGGLMGVWAVGNTPGDIGDLLVSNDAIALHVQAPAGGGDFDLNSYDYSDDTQDAAAGLSLSTTYYVETERSSTTFTATICTVSHGCSTPVDTISQTVPSTTYQYVMSTFGRGNSGTEVVTGTVSNMDLAPPTDSVTITTPDNNDRFQRDIATNQKTGITVSGTYIDSSGDPTAIEYRFDGGAWSTLDASPSSGTFSGTVTLGAGDGALDVRMADDTGVTHSITVGVGDIFLVAGQSNAMGAGATAQTYTGSLGSRNYRLDDAWTADASDPSHTTTGALGTQWPLVANQIEAQESTPVYFLTTAVSATCLVAAPAEWGGPGGTAYDPAVQQVIDSGVDDVLAVLWHHGQCDAGQTQAAYNAGLDGLLTDLRAEGGALSDVVIVAAGFDDSNGTAANINALRGAFIEAWEDNTGILPGPTVYDMDLDSGGSDGTHYRSAALIAELGDRWFEAISANFYDGTQTSPRPTGYFHSSDLTEVYVDYDQTVTVADTSATAWDIEDNGGNRDANITNISASGSRLTITFSPALVEPITVSLGDGSDAAGATVPRATGADTLPSYSFVQEATSEDSFLATFSINYDTPGNISDGLSVSWLLLGLLPVGAVAAFAFRRRIGRAF